MKQIIKKQYPLVVRIFVAVATAIIIGPGAHTAMASSIAYQQDSSYKASTQFVAIVYRFLGTGLSGSPQGVNLYLSSQGVVTETMQSAIVDCGVTSATTSCPVLTFSNIATVAKNNWASILPVASTSQTFLSSIPNTGASSTFAFDPTHYYALVSVASNGNQTFNYYGVNSGTSNIYNKCTGVCDLSLKDIYFDLYDGSGTSLVNSFTSYIISMTPLNQSVVSSGTPITITFKAFVAPTDLTSLKGVRFNLSYLYDFTGPVAPNIGCGPAVPHGLFPASRSGQTVGTNCPGQMSIDATSTGTFSYSTTTTNLGVGLYTLTGGIYQTVLGITNPFGSINNSTTTYFVSGTSTFWNNAAASGTLAMVGQAIINYTGSSTLSNLNSCNLTSFSNFNPVICIWHLFVPTWDDVTVSTNSVLTRMGAKFPWGYLTRMHDIFAYPQTSVLPSLSFTIPQGLPVQGYTLDLSPWGKLWGSTSYLGTATSSYAQGKTLRNIVEPYWNDLVDIFFAISLLALFIKIKGLK